MQSISVYDIEADKLNRVADDNDTTVAEIIEQLCEYLSDIKESNGWR